MQSSGFRVHWKTSRRRSDHALMQRSRWGANLALPRIVSLFSGAGGLDLGYRDAGFPLTFAVDSSPAAIKTHQRNFRDTTSVVANLVELRPEGVLRHLDDLLSPDDSIGVSGGPPCQGFSRARRHHPARFGRALRGAGAGYLRVTTAPPGRVTARREGLPARTCGALTSTASRDRARLRPSNVSGRQPSAHAPGRE